MTSRLPFAAVLCLTGTLAAQTLEGRNEHTFYNKAFRHTTAATRATTDRDDQIFFTQPADFRRNASKGTGWHVVLQDENQATSERVKLSWHGVQGLAPDKTPISVSEYTLFGGGSGRVAYFYTLTSATSTDLPEHVALGLFLPKPKKWILFPEDACTIHYQRGNQTKVEFSKRQQWTWKLDPVTGNVVPEWTGTRYVGSTFHWSGLYDAPVLQFFNATNAYQTAFEDLFGPETLAFASDPPARQDAVGLRLSGGDAYKTQGNRLAVAGVLFGPDYQKPPVRVPGFGTLLVSGPTLGFYLPLNAIGLARTATILIPKNLNATVAWQAVFVAIDTQRSELARAELSNAARTVFP